jgi:hypothetical protein
MVDITTDSFGVTSVHLHAYDDIAVYLTLPIQTNILEQEPRRYNYVKRARPHFLVQSTYLIIKMCCFRIWGVTLYLIGYRKTYFGQYLNSRTC